MSIVQAQVLEPYAQGLMSAAQGQNLADRIGEDMRGMLEVIRSSEELQQLLANPFVTLDAKKAILERVVGDSVHPYTRNFLKLLVDRRRILFLEGICLQYLALLRKLNQTVLAEVTVAVAISDEQQQKVREKVLGITGATSVELDIKIDPEIIGGVIIKVGSQFIDSSLRGQLRRMGISLNA
ncbi:MAG: ATP synthase F1 subunit delta [Oscillatoriaceae cyanobacterium]